MHSSTMWANFNVGQVRARTNLQILGHCAGDFDPCVRFWIRNHFQKLCSVALWAEFSVNVRFSDLQVSNSPNVDFLSLDYPNVDFEFPDPPNVNFRFSGSLNVDF